MTKTKSPPFQVYLNFTSLTLTVSLLRLCISAQAPEEHIYKEPQQDSKSIYFAEPFSSETALKRFVPSTASKDGVEDDIAKYDGRWEVGPVQKSALLGDLSLIMKDKAKHHAIAGKLSRPFKPEGKPLVFQYEVKFQTENTCGGAYVKLLSQDPDTDFTKFNDKTPYTIMFGPDRCGTQEKFHFILRHVNPVSNTIEEKHARKPEGFNNKYFETEKSRLFRLVIRPDSSYEMSVDREVLSKGHLLSDMTPNLVPEEIIDDAMDVKPEDWDDMEKIPDPEAVKPDDWNEDAPKQIEDETALKPEGWLDDEESMVPDISAEKPGDWDDEMDGEWEAPLVDNPKCKEAPGCGHWSPPLVDNPQYKGKWRPPLIENPNYKGVWKPRKIKNPDYFEEPNPFDRITPIAAIGLELWTMSESVAFDNFILADDISVVEKWTDETWAMKVAKEGATAPSGPTFLHQMFDAANEKPWLWGVYVIGLLVPICIMTMIFCPVKKEKTDTEDPAVVDETEQNQYDAIASDSQPNENPKETKEEEALRKKTDAPVPDAPVPDVEEEEEEVDDDVDPVVEAAPKETTPEKKSNTPLLEEAMHKDVTTNGSKNGSMNGTLSESEEEEPKMELGKSVLNGFPVEDEILRRSPRLRSSKGRARKE